MADTARSRWKVCEAADGQTRRSLRRETKGETMELNIENGDPAERNSKSGGCPCGCGTRGSNKIAVAIWVTLLLGGVAYFTYFQQKRAAEARSLLDQAYELYYRQEFAASTDLLRKSAELGNAWAQAYYGERLKTGFAAEQNLTEAVKWLRKAAKQECPEAYYQLGICYENGEGVERNLDKAEELFRKAQQAPDFAASAQRSLERIEILRRETPPAGY